MKKRLLSALLALALVFVLLPTTALAKVVKSDEDISIGGIDWKFESDSEVGYFYNGNFTTTEPSDSYLKLTKSSDTITVTVSGYVTVSDINVHNNFLTQDKINLIITGNKGSTLNIECKDTHGAALETYQSGDITIKGGITVNANFSADNTDRYTDCYGIRASKNLIITGKGTTVNAVNADDAAAVKVDGNITVSDGAQLKATNKYSKKVTNYTGNAYAIECGGQLSISGNNTKVTAKTSNGKQAISGTVSNGDKLTFKVQLYLASSTLDQKPMDKALGYKYVEITQAPTDPYVFINGQYAIIGQETPIPGGTGTYLYKKTTYNGSFLTLKGVNITGTKDGPARFIQFGKNGGYYTIQLEGENKISGFSSGIVAPEDPGVNDVTVVLSGSGSLDITANQYAIDMQVGKLKFENTGTIKLTTGYKYPASTCNALHVAGNVTIDKTKYDIVGVKQDIEGTRENISDNPNLDTILKGTSTNEALYFKSITITPAAAKDSTISYGNKTLKQGETIYGETSGTATVDRKNNTITLDNFKGNYPLEFNAEFTPNFITLIGDSTLSAVETKYQDLTISVSGSGSLTVGSIKVHNQKTSSDDKPNLTINGATVTVGTAELNARAIDIDGDLTVTNGSLKATSTSDSVPTVQVGGNASFTGSTVTITNNSTTQGKSGEYSYEVSTGLYVGGTLDIKNAAKVTSTVIGGNAIYAKGDITISGDSTEVNAQNSAYKFSAISTNGTVNISDNSTVKAENLKRHQGDDTGKTDPPTGKEYNACPAITGKIANKNTQNKLHIEGFTTSSPGTSHAKDGVVSNLDIAPSSVEPFILHYDVTITRGDEVTHTPSPVVIAGTTLLNDTYYTITNGSTVAEGTESNYNAFYNSTTKTLKLNNASINGTGVKAIEANVGGYTFTIELVGNNIIKTSGFANNVIDITGNLYFTGSGTAEVSGKGTPIYATYKIDVSADVTITNTEKAGSFTFSAYGENSSNYKGANTFAIGTGYTAYATTDKTTWAVYDNTTASENESYTTLRITTQPPETGGGSTHQHTYDQSAWKSDATHHWQECTDPNCPDPTKGITNKASHIFSNGACTVCGYRGQTEEHHFGTEWFSNAEYHWHKCTDEGCDAISGKAPHEWTGWRIDEPSPGMHNRFCNCGYNDYSHHYNLVYAAAGEAGHYQYCTLGNCTFKTSTVSHNYDGDTCTICNYTKSGEIEPPTPDNPGTIVIIRPAEEEKPAQQPNPSTGANDLVGLAVAAAVAAALGSAALLRKHD